MHHLRDSAIPAGLLSDFDEILRRWWIPKSVVLSKNLTSWLKQLKIVKISNFAARVIENLWENAPTAENAYNLVVYPPKATKLKTKKIYLHMRTNAENFVKNMQNSRLWWANLWAKFEILTVLIAVFPHFWPYEREIWQGGADRLSKCNSTGMAAL